MCILAESMRFVYRVVPLVPDALKFSAAIFDDYGLREREKWMLSFATVVTGIRSNIIPLKEKGERSEREREREREREIFIKRSKT